MRLTPLLAAALALLPACTVVQRTPSAGSGGAPPTHRILFHAAKGDRSLSVRVADTPDERAEGLMGAQDLPADEGMAFAFAEPSTAAFWMKDTLIPLSIAFVGPDGTIVTLANMAPCRTDPCPTYSARAPYTLAVEANAGWFRDHGIHEGDRCSWPEAA